MKIIIQLTIVINLLIFNFLQAQENKKLDSLLQVYNTTSNDSVKLKTIYSITRLTSNGDPSFAEKYYKEAIVLSKKLKNPLWIAETHQGMANLLQYQSKLDSAKYYSEVALRYFKKINALLGQAQIYHGLATIEMYKGNYDVSLSYLKMQENMYSEEFVDSSGLGFLYELKGKLHNHKGNYKLALLETLKGLQMAEAMRDSLRIADFLNNLADIEKLLKNYKKSINYNQNALKIYKKFNDRIFEAGVLNDIGVVYYLTNKNLEALEYLNKSLELSREVKDPYQEAIALGSLGKLYTKAKDYEKAISHLKESIKIHEETKGGDEIIDVINNLGKVYNEINKPEIAITYFNRAIELAKTNQEKANESSAYFNRSKSYELLKNTDKAFSDFKEFQILNDSIFNTSKSQQIEELRTIYETEKKEKEIAFQKNEIELLIQKAEINNLQRILLGVGLGLSLIIFSLGFYALKQKMKKNKLEKEKVDTELEFKKKELTTHALNLARKNEVLEGLKQKAEELKSGETSKNGYNQLIRTINFDLQDDNNWENFAKYFEEVHKDFNGNVKQKYPEITSNELRLLSLLKMNLSSKEIANILNISPEGIKKARYRLRKKLEITSEDSLQDLVINL